MNKIKIISEIRGKLLDGKVSLGSWIQIPDASMAEVMGASGYDWIAVDMEHGSISHHELPNIFRALEIGNTLPIARIASGNLDNCKQALDAGAGGVIIPMVYSAEQLEEIISLCRWPPAGTRGVGFSRANLFGMNFEDYSVQAQNPIIVAMIEHINAIDALENILKVPGLDAILIGPYDLSASMGITGKFDTIEFKNIMNTIFEQCKKNKKSCGLHVVDPDKKILAAAVEDGHQFIAYSLDSVFMRRFCKRPIGF